MSIQESVGRIPGLNSLVDVLFGNGGLSSQRTLEEGLDTQKVAVQIVIKKILTVLFTMISLLGALFFVPALGSTVAEFACSHAMQWLASLPWIAAAPSAAFWISSLVPKGVVGGMFIGSWAIGHLFARILFGPTPNIALVE